MQQEPTDNTHDNIQPATPSQVSPKVADNKRLIVAIAIGLGLLLAVLIVLVAVLLSQRNTAQRSTETKNSDTSQSSTNTTNKKGEVVRVVIYEKNPSLQVTIYQPRQTATNTTVDYSVKNICKSGCRSQEYVDSYNLGIIDPASAYLLDNESGTKFNPIVDAKNKPLATDSCSAFVAPGQSVDCFAAFTRVPNNTTFSFVLRGIKVDDLTAK